jgi:MSHA biogenesis protein MshO
MRTPLDMRGFTLLEAIMVIVITGILGALVASFATPLRAYFSATQRADLGDEADTALRRISRELHGGLPNSVRVTASGGSSYLEFLPTVTGGRYRATQDCSAACTGNILDFSSADTGFDVIGTLNQAPAAGNEIVIYNLGISGASAYEGSNSAVLTATSSGCVLSTTQICFSAGKQFPFESPGKRFQIVSGPVTFACSGTTLWRYTGYAKQAGQPTNLNAAPLNTATSKTRMATHVDCANSSFTYAPGVTQRTGLVSMRLTIASGGETIMLQHQVQVPNVP